MWIDEILRNLRACYYVHTFFKFPRWSVKKWLRQVHVPTLVISALFTGIVSSSLSSPTTLWLLSLPPLGPLPFSELSAFLLFRSSSPFHSHSSLCFFVSLPLGILSLPPDPNPSPSAPPPPFHFSHSLELVLPTLFPPTPPRPRGPHGCFASRWVNREPPLFRTATTTWYFPTPSRINKLRILSHFPFTEMLFSSACLPLYLTGKRSRKQDILIFVRGLPVARPFPEPMRDPPHA